MRHTVQGWLLWIGCILAVHAIDYRLRMADGDIQTGALPVAVPVTVLLLVAPVAVVLLYRGTVRFRETWQRLLVTGFQVVAGGYVLFWIVLMYGCTAGIEC